MPPSFDVSPEVLDRLSALGGGERSPDQVLRLLLGLPEALPEKTARTSDAGFVDLTYGVRFAAGFEIFRTYKGRPFRACAEGGGWRLDADGRLYDSLNRLSRAVIDGNENAWMFWHYRGPDGRPRRIAEQRDPAKVQRRPRRRPASPPPAKPLPLPAQPEPVAATPPLIAPAAGMAWQPRPAPLVRTRPAKR